MAIKIVNDVFVVIITCLIFSVALATPTTNQPDVLNPGVIIQIPKSTPIREPVVASSGIPAYTGWFDRNGLAYTDSYRPDGLLQVRHFGPSADDQALLDLAHSIHNGWLEIRNVDGANPLHVHLFFANLNNGPDKEIEFAGNIPLPGQESQLQLQDASGLDASDYSYRVSVRCIVIRHCRIAKISIFKPFTIAGTQVMEEADAVFRSTPVKMDLVLKPQIQHFADPGFKKLAILFINGNRQGTTGVDEETGKVYVNIYPNRLSHMTMDSFTVGNGISRFLLRMKFQFQSSDPEAIRPAEILTYLEGWLVKTPNSDSASSNPMRALPGNSRVDGYPIYVSDDLSARIGNITLENNDGLGHLAIRLLSRGTDPDDVHDQIILNLTRE